MSLVKQILYYLQGYIKCESVMTNNGHTEITWYSDYDWVGNVMDHKLTTGYCMFVGIH